MKDCIFCQIIDGKIPAVKLYEDDLMIVIKDITPQARIHLLMIPKNHYSSITNVTTNDSIVLGMCLKKIGEIAEQLGLAGGFRIVSNSGNNARQSVSHVHLHILGGEMLSDKMC